MPVGALLIFGRRLASEFPYISPRAARDHYLSHRLSFHISIVFLSITPPRTATVQLTATNILSLPVHVWYSLTSRY